MRTFRREACNLYLWAVLLLLPVLVHKKYEDITGFKEMFFLGVFVLFFVCSMMAMIGECASRRNAGDELPKVRDRLRSMSALDWSVFAFGLIALLSSLTTRYGLRHALLADGALFVGGATLFSLSVAYFLFSRGAEAPRMGFVYGFFASSLIVVLMGFLNHLQIDPLGMHEGNVNETLGFMASTIGNVDYYHGYVAVFTMFFAAYRADMKQGWRATAVDILLVICYLDTWTARASGVFGGLSFGLVMLAFMGLCSFSCFKNLFWQGILVGIAGIAAEVLCRYRPDFLKTGELSGIFLQRHLWLPVGMLCVIGRLLLWQWEKRDGAEKITSVLRKCCKPYMIFAALMLVGATAFVVLTPQGEMLSGRAFIWDDIKRMYPLGSVREKWIGIGPGCIDFARKKLGMLAEPNVDYLYSMGYETAHNELYEYGLELGILGAAAYICIEVSFFASYFRAVIGSKKKSDFASSASGGGAAGLAAGVPCERELGCCAVLFAAYLGQGMTNGPNPVPTIVAFTFLALFRRYQIPDMDVF